MGKVIDKTESPEAKVDLEKETKDIEDRKRNATNALLSTLDLPEDKLKEEETKDTETPEVEEKKKEPGKKEEPEVEEFKSDKTDEEILEADDKDLTEQEKEYKKQLQEEGEEELIPKSKVEKRFRQLTEEIRKLKAGQKTPEVTSDPDMVQLEKMTSEKLIELRQKIRQEIRDGNRAIARGEEIDEKRLDSLDILADKVDEAIRSYPIRFQQKQVALFNQAAQEITSDLSEEFPENEIEKACSEIKEIAEKIYSTYPKLQQSEDGQALALRLASDHWKAKREFSLGKSEVDRLKKTQKKLLRKITLDKNVINADKSRKAHDDMRVESSKGGTDKERIDIIKSHPHFNIDALIPDEFKGR